jgi:hypothetical protein
VHGVPASGPGHLATPLEDDDVESDGYPGLQTLGTSDLLPTVHSHGQAGDVEEDMHIVADGMDFDVVFHSADSHLFLEGLEDLYGDLVDSHTGDYIVTEAVDDGELPSYLHDLEDADVRTLSRSMSVDPHQFIVEEPLTDEERVDDRATSLGVVSVYTEVPESSVQKDLAPMDDVDELEEAPEPQQQHVEDFENPSEAQTSVALPEDASQPYEQDPDIKFEATHLQQNDDDAGSPLLGGIPLPVSADPTAPSIFSNVGTPTSESMPYLKAAVQGKGSASGLFTPLTRTSSASAVTDYFVDVDAAGPDTPADVSANGVQTDEIVEETIEAGVAAEGSLGVGQTDAAIEAQVSAE